jgi:ADP-ribose pyrophosphatase YjhB (NUDIX family)
MSEQKPLWRRIRHRLYHTWFRFQRPMTLGVRAILVDSENRIFLVRHGYVPGWHFPGGGVETGETLLDAVAKEVREEGCIRLTGAPRLHGVFYNKAASPRDHVAVFVIRDFAIEGIRKPDYEIAETGWFSLDLLPEGVSKGTRARLAEVFEDRAIGPVWS